MVEEILALCMENSVRKEPCVDTVKAAVGRFPTYGAILHSDWGGQNASEAFQAALAASGHVQSPSGLAMIAQKSNLHPVHGFLWICSYFPSIIIAVTGEQDDTDTSFLSLPFPTRPHDDC